MGLFSFTQELAMDLGTANSIIANNAGKILLDEPSIVALDRKSDKMIALGGKRNKCMVKPTKYTHRKTAS